MTGTPRPFGLRFATHPKGSVELDLDLIRYDEQRQISMVRDGADWVALADHRMGVTLQTTGAKTTEDEIFDKPPDPTRR